MQRGLGALLHITSLAGTSDVGCFSDAYKFIDFLKSAGVKYWQVLAFGPTGYGDSPYAPLSVFALNPYFIAIDNPPKKQTKQSDKVNFGELFVNKNRALKELYKRGYDKAEFDAYVRDNKYWIESYATYMAIKCAHGNVGYLSLPKPFRDPKSAEVKAFIKLHKEEINYNIFVQMIAAKQWEAVKKYANQNGVKIIGDVPMYPAMDSGDVWAFNNQFEFADGEPVNVAGVPPDYFSADGQFWGNPIYDFKKMSRDRYKWWMERIKHTGKMFDVLRIDHFRAFDSYYKIPYGQTNAKVGVWAKGPGIKFFNILNEAVPNLKLILEDLGMLTKSVTDLRDATGYPGMRVMQFGFDGNSENEHLPDNYPKNCVAYIGTHDNDTFASFLKNKQTRKHVDKYLHSSSLSTHQVTRLAFENIMASRADIVVLCMQDLLFAGSAARMNTPGREGGNWQYRIKPTALTPELAAYLKMLVNRSGR